MRRAAARRGRRGRTSSPLTSGSACGPALEQVAGDDVGVGVAGHQRARGLAVQALALGPRRGPRSIAAAIRPWARRSPSGRAGRRPAARRGPGPSSPTATPATAATTCGGAPSPSTASAAATPRSRGAQRGQPPADDVAGDRGDRRRVVAGPVERLGPCAAIWRPSSPSSHGLPPDRAVAVAADRRRGVGRQAADQLRGAARRQRLRVQHGRRAHAAEQAQQVRRRRRGRRRGRRRRSAAAGPRSAAPGRRAPPATRGRPTARRRRRARAGARSAIAEHSQRTLWATSIVESPLGRRARPAAARRPAPRRRRAAARARPRSASRSGRLQQRAHDAEGEVALERPGGGAADEAAGVAGERRGVLEQRGLAEPGGRLEHDDPAAPAGQAATAPREHLELDGALDQRRIVGGGRGLRCDDVEMGHRAATRGTDHVRCDAQRGETFPASRKDPRR